MGSIVTENESQNINNTLKEQEKIIREEFKKAWDKIIQDLKADKLFVDIPQTLDWITTVLQENVPTGKQNRAMAMIGVYRHIKGEDRTPESDFLSYVLAWMSEIGQAACLIADDIMDGSPYRRGLPSWYTKPKVGLSAINDAFLLENLNYHILRKYFENSKLYDKLLRLSQDAGLVTVLGQILDTRISIDGDMSGYNRKTHAAIVKYKTSFYSFVHPVLASLILAEVDTPELMAKAEEILINIGDWFQIQDDYLDVYGDPEETGKVGTDILDKKCSWMIVTALEDATPEQKKVLLENYGKHDPDKNCENKVKEIYKELKLRNKYRTFEENTYKQIADEIETCPELKTLKKPLKLMIDKLYLRRK